MAGKNISITFFSCIALCVKLACGFLRVFAAFSSLDNPLWPVPGCVVLYCTVRRKTDSQQLRGGTLAV